MRWPQRARPARGGGGAPVPVTVRADSQTLHVEDGYCATLAVTGYPAEVSMGWLEPLLTYPGRLDVALHIEPIPAEIATGRLRRQMARLEAGWRSDYARGRLEDLEASTAADDARDLAAALARGEGHLFRAGLYLTVHAPTRDTLTSEVSRVRALTSSMLLDARPATFRPVQGWATTMPLGVDALKMRRSLDTSALAASFPFTSPDLVTELGDTTVLYGLAAGSSVAAWDRFAQDNHNAVILARSGSGKSYLAKLELLRMLYAGVQSFVIDPEDEYGRLTQAVGGTHIPLGAPGIHLNPLDLPPDAQASNDALTRRALFCHTFVQTLLATPLHPAETAALDTAIIDTYAAAGITTDPRTWARPAPLLRHLAATLADGDPHAATLAARLAPYVTGTHRALFEQATTNQPDGHLVTISLRDLPDELKTPGMLLVLDAIWRQVTNPTTRRPRLITVDEGWLLMREPAGAKFLFRLAKAARKHWAGLTVITQDAPDVLGSDLGRAVVANAATQILLRQSPTAIAQITDAFGLTEGEAQYLLAAGRGECLLVAGTQRCAFRALASPAEHDLITTNPAELDDDPVEDP